MGKAGLTHDAPGHHASCDLGAHRIRLKLGIVVVLIFRVQLRCHDIAAKIRGKRIPAFAPFGKLAAAFSDLLLLLVGGIHFFSIKYELMVFFETITLSARSRSRTRV